MRKSICYPLIESLKPAYRKKNLDKYEKKQFKKNIVLCSQIKKKVYFMVNTILNKYKWSKKLLNVFTATLSGPEFCYDDTVLPDIECQ